MLPRGERQIFKLSQSTTGQHSRVMNANDPIDDTHPELGTVLDALKSKHPQGGRRIKMRCCRRTWWMHRSITRSFLTQSQATQ